MLTIPRRFVLQNRSAITRLLSTEPAVEDAGEEKPKVEEVPVPVANEDGTFRVLEIPGTKKREFRGPSRYDQSGQAIADGMKKRLFPPQAPRYQRMSPTKSKWTDVWPAAQSFKWSVVPLPVRQGYVKQGQGVVPGKYANAELMKIPNFFHLTPEHIRKHCKAIKQFCTPWPAELDSDAKVKEHFPVEITTSSYCHAGPSVRHPDARRVSLRVNLNALGKLDYHAKDKILRLLGHRYDATNGNITIKADRCPTSKQNYDYAMYLLTAVYFEAWKIEDWERSKQKEDLDKYYWHLSPSRQNVVDYVKRITKTGKAERFESVTPQSTDVDIVRSPVVASYRDAVTDLMNGGESHQSLQNYRASVERLLGLPVSKFAAPSPSA